MAESQNVERMWRKLCLKKKKRERSEARTFV